MKDEKKFRKAQYTFIFSSMIVYAFFYLTRKNLSMAMPGMLEEKVISTYAVGTMLSLHGILYGLSRFVNGFWADRLNGRIFMTVGLSLSALMNFCFGCTSVSLLFAIFWVLNGWTQGMGFPPCAKMLTHWIHPKELATKMSIWNTSHSFGAVMALGLCSLLLGLGFGWRWCFYVPAVLAGIVAVFCFFKVKDSPTEAGVEELEIEAKADASEDDRAVNRILALGDDEAGVKRVPVMAEYPRIRDGAVKSVDGRHVAVDRARPWHIRVLRSEVGHR
jgi:OPA family glycerol-3-phosphate transporter-like MFS transporter/OPA family sugar phosphate sensor protein UhpC-like MFS transporter